MIESFVAGFLAGFLGSMPVAGPIAVLVVARSLQDQVRQAVLIGWGAALPEAAYAFLAYWGFSKLLADLPYIEPLSRGVAAAILLVLAYGLFRYEPPANQTVADEAAPSRGAGSFLLGFTISALNPTLIVTWTAVLGVVASTGLLELQPAYALPFSAAAALGMGAWCLLSATLVSSFRARLSPPVIVRVHRVMAVLVALLAVGFVVAFVRSL